MLRECMSMAVSPSCNSVAINLAAGTIRTCWCSTTGTLLPHACNLGWTVVIVDGPKIFSHEVLLVLSSNLNPSLLR